MSSPLIVGSVAYDTLRLPSGVHPRELGGSATYAALAASLFVRPNLVAVVGNDFDESSRAVLRERNVNMEGLEQADGLSFSWEGEYSADLTQRETLRTDLNVFADFSPKIPPGFQSSEWIMLGNIDPELQIRVLDQVRKPKLVIADTMNFWIEGRLDKLKELLKRIDLLVINEEEARQLAGRYSLVDVARHVHELGPRAVVIKQGEYGAMLFEEQLMFSAPAFPLNAAVDPTGAGDTFAGGMLGYLSQQEGASHETLRRAIVHGSVLASFCVEHVGTSGLHQLTREKLDERLVAFKRLSEF